MVIKGRARTNGVQLAGYLLNQIRNDRVEVMAINHPERSDLHRALADMQDMTDTGQRGVKGLYHAQISPAPGYEMSRDQWIDSVRVLEAELGLEGQPHALVLHEHEGRIHAHVVWQRTDCEKLTLISDSHNYAAHERAARQLENMFGHERIDGPHTGKTKDDKSYSHAEDQQGKRSTLLTTNRKEQLTTLWHQCDGGKAFTAALHEVGYVLARGDRRGMVIVDEHGEVHSLARQITGVKTKELERQLDHINKEDLPSVTEALAEQMQKREDKFTILDPDQQNQRKKQHSDHTPASAKGPALKRGIETPEDKERRLRALTRNVIGLINSKIEQVTENSRLYQSAKSAITQAKKQVVGFMRSIGFDAKQWHTNQPEPQQHDQDREQQAARPDMQRDDPPGQQPDQSKAPDDQKRKKAFDLEAIERQNRDKQRDAGDKAKARGFDLEALEKKNREKQKRKEEQRQPERGKENDGNERE